MAKVTLDDYLDEVRELVVLAEAFEIELTPQFRARAKMLKLGLLRIEAQLAAGESSRAKLRAHKARKNRLSTGAAVPLWGDE